MLFKVGYAWPPTHSGVPVLPIWFQQTFVVCLFLSAFMVVQR